MHGRVFEGLESWQPQATKVASNSYAATYLPSQREPGPPFENFPSSTPLQLQGCQVSASKKCRQRYRIRSLLRGKPPCNGKNSASATKSTNVFQPSNNSKSIGMKMASCWRRKRDLGQWLTFGPLSQSSNCLESCVQNPGSKHRGFRGCQGDHLESYQRVKGCFTRRLSHLHARNLWLFHPGCEVHCTAFW